MFQGTFYWSILLLVFRLCVFLRRFIITTPKYKYVDLGLFNIKNVDLSRKVRFKVHKEYGDRREDRTARDKGIKIGRFYRDFQDYLELNPTCSIVGMVMNFPIRKASKFPLKQEIDYPKCFSAAQTLHGRKDVLKRTMNMSRLHWNVTEKNKALF